MSNRAAVFVEEWVRENAVKPVEGAPAGDNSEARLRAEACLAAAKYEGIAREDIEEETGDLVAYMGAMIANLVNHPEEGRRLRMTIAKSSSGRRPFTFGWMKVVLRGARMRIGKWRLN